jgi:hypothetical protein
MYLSKWKGGGYPAAPFPCSPRLTREAESSVAGAAPARTAGSGSGVRTVLRRGCVTLSFAAQGTPCSRDEQSPGRGNCASPRSQTEKAKIGRLFDLEVTGAPLLCVRSELALRGTDKRDSSTRSRTASGAGATEGSTTEAERSLAGCRRALSTWHATARALHFRHSADSRSRPPRPSRHIRDPGPDGVRERRVPLTGVRFPLCYLGWSRLESRRTLRGRRSLVLRATP